MNKFYSVVRASSGVSWSGFRQNREPDLSAQPVCRVASYLAHGFPRTGFYRAHAGLHHRDNMIHVCMYGDTYSKSMDQPGEVANPARGQLNRENGYISLSAFAPENLVSRDGFGSPVPCQPAHLHAQAESGAYLRDSSRVPRSTVLRYAFLYCVHLIPPP